jgi:ABC-type sugar transport system permease subunit
MFNEPFVLMAPQLSPNGPANATLTPVIYLYQNAFQQFQQGYAAAVAWALFVLIFGVTLFYFRRQGDEGVLSA